MTNPSANQNRPPSPDLYRFFACVSSVWLVLRAGEVAGPRTEGPVSPDFLPDTELPAGGWVLQPALGVQLEPTTPAMPSALLTWKMAHILGDIRDFPKLVLPVVRRLFWSLPLRHLERHCIHRLRDGVNGNSIAWAFHPMVRQCHWALIRSWLPFFPVGESVQR